MPPSTVDRRILPGLLAGILLLLGIGGCAAEFPQSSLHPLSDFATAIDDLFTRIFWWAVLVFVVVEGLLVYALVRFREKEQAEQPEPVYGNTLLEIGWTLAPAVILVFIAIPTIQTIWQWDNPPNPRDDVLRIEVVGNQWWWEFRYPELGIRTANELHVPVGRTVELRLTSDDVIHSFWFPRAGGKRDVLPGRQTMLWFTMDSAGVYPGQCAEFCGTSHALMKMLMVAQDSTEFREWAERQREPAGEPDEALARQGRDLFLSGNCIGCHTVRGTNARGQIGPDLTHVGSRRTIAAGMLENTPENLAAWLRDPQAIKPDNLMQIPDMTEEDIERLAAYLSSLE